MCLLRINLPNLCPNMNNFDVVDFSECHSEEVISFFWRSVYLFQERPNYFYSTGCKIWVFLDCSSHWCIQSPFASSPPTPIGHHFTLIVGQNYGFTNLKCRQNAMCAICRLQHTYKLLRGARHPWEFMMKTLICVAKCLKSLLLWNEDPPPPLFFLLVSRTTKKGFFILVSLLVAPLHHQYRKTSSRGTYGHDPFWNVFEEYPLDSRRSDSTMTLSII